MNKSIYKRLYSLVSGYWPFLVMSSLSAFIYVAFNGLSVWLTATLFNNILTDFDELLKSQILLSESKDSLNGQLKFWTNKLILRDTAIESLRVLCYTLIGSFLIKNFFLYIKNIALTYIQFNLIKKLRAQLYAHLQSMSLSFFDKRQTGELSSIVINDVSNMRVAFGTSFHKLFVEPINIIVFIALLFIINVKLALLSIVIVPLTGVVVVIIGKSIRRRSKRTAEKIARIMGIMSENLNSIRIVKSFAMEAFETNRFEKEQDRHYALDLRQAKLRLISSPITEMIGAFIAVILLWIGGHDVLVSNDMSSEDFIRFILILFSVLQPIRSLSNVSINLQKGFASADRVFDVLDTQPSIVSKPNAMKIDDVNEQIMFKNVGFNYEGTENILENISFSMKKGTVTALVGASGLVFAVVGIQTSQAFYKRDYHIDANAESGYSPTKNTAAFSFFDDFTNRDSTIQGITTLDVPLSFLLTLLMFLGEEVALSFTADDNVSRRTHIVGFAVGAAFVHFIERGKKKKRSKGIFDKWKR